MAGFYGPYNYTFSVRKRQPTAAQISGNNPRATIMLVRHKGNIEAEPNRRKPETQHGNN